MAHKPAQRSSLARSTLPPLLLPMLLAGTLWTAGARSAVAEAEAALPAKPTVAVLAASAEPATEAMSAQLLERLDADDALRLVEREQIDLVLREHELALLLGAQGGSERLQVGKLLGADILLMIRPEQERIDVVVAHSASGLRVRATQLPDSDSARAAEGAHAELQAAIATLRQPIRIVCAVPPFLSHDLSHRFNHLQTTYARLVEQALLAQPGLIVVELEEARALAREMAIRGEAVVRRLPYYFVGEFRHDVAAGPVPRHLQLALFEGERRLAVRRLEDADREQASEFLRTATAELLNTLGESAQAPADPAGEAAQLAQRAMRFQTVGLYSEALPLLEASLLLEPRQPDISEEAAVAAVELGWAEYVDAILTGKQPGREATERSLAHLRVALDHVRVRASQGPWRALRSRVSHAIFRATECLTMFGIATEDDEKVLELLREHQREWRQVLIGAVNEHAHRPEASEWTVELISSIFRAAPGESPEDYDEYRTGLAPIAANLPQGRVQQEWLERSLRVIGVPPRDDFLRRLQEVERSELEIVRMAARRFREQALAEKVTWDRRLEGRAQYRVPTPADTREAPPDEVVYRPLPPLTKPGTEFGLPTSISVEAFWMKLDDRTDLYFGRDASHGGAVILEMNEPGRLVKLVDLPDVPRARFAATCWDGRYLWLALDAPRPLLFEPEVIVIDRLKRRVTARVTAAEGLPGFHHGKMLPIAPGVVVVTAVFGMPGTYRSYRAVIAYDGQQPQIEVFWEQRVPDLVFRESQSPAEFETIRSHPDDPTRLQLVKARPGVEPTYFDLPALAGAAAPSAPDPKADPLHVRDGRFYWCTTRDPNEVYRWDLATFEVAREAQGLPGATVMCFHGGYIHMVGRDWWVGESFEKPLRKLRGATWHRPHLHSLKLSAHYGLLLHTSESGWMTYQVDLAGAGLSPVDEP